MSKVIIQPDGKTAKDESGKIHKVAGLIVRKDRGGDAFYPVNEKFFKIACPPNTQHAINKTNLTSNEIYIM